MNMVEYQQEAANAQNMASQSSRAAEKAAWLCIAQGWISLWKQRGYNPSEMVERKGGTPRNARRSKRKSKLGLRANAGMRRNKADGRRVRKSHSKRVSG